MSGDSGPSKVETWDVDPSGMMRYYQTQGYKLGQSIADLVDNCFDAGAKEIDITIDLDGITKKPFIRVYDNGRGMTERELKHAMKLGGDRDRNEHDLGVFGIGMKLSSLSQANQVTIVTLSNGKKATRRIDATYIRERNENIIQKFPLSSSAYNSSEDLMIENEWTTMVLLEELHGISWITYDVPEDVALEKEINRIKVHLQLTYHRILESDPSVSLKLQGKIINPLDPAMRWESDIKFGTIHHDNHVIVKIDNKSVSVPIAFVIVPHRKRRSINKKKCALMDKGYYPANPMQGLYLYRNNRLIQYGEGWQGLMAGHLEEHHKLGKIFINILPSYFEWFGLNPTKTEVKLPSEFLRKLAVNMGKTRRWEGIKNGAKMTFKDAALHRYNNEGKIEKIKNKKSHESENRQHRPPQHGLRKARKYKPKPKVVVNSIDEGDPKFTLVKLDKSKDGYDKLLQYLRMCEE